MCVEMAPQVFVANPVPELRIRNAERGANSSGSYLRIQRELQWTRAASSTCLACFRLSDWGLDIYIWISPMQLLRV